MSPTSYALGVALVGATFVLMGTQGIFRKKKTDLNAFPERPRLEVKFLSIAETFNSERLLRELSRHNVVFLNFQSIASSPMYKSQFLSDLRQLGRHTGAVLKLVANDIIMVALPTVKITTGMLESDMPPSQPDASSSSHLSSPGFP